MSDCSRHLSFPLNNLRKIFDFTRGEQLIGGFGYFSFSLLFFYPFVFKIQFLDGADCATRAAEFATAEDGSGNPITFTALANQNDIMKIIFPSTINTRCIMIVPQTFEGAGQAAFTFFKRTTQTVTFYYAAQNTSYF